MSTTDVLKNKMAQLKISPANIQQVALDMLEEISDGAKLVVDPTNPFVFSLETAATASAVSIDRTEALLRKAYPRIAQDKTDLYSHMSDEDYKDRFSTPSESVTMSIWLDLEEVKAKAVTDISTGLRKLVIPENTAWMVKDYHFYSHFPVIINVLPNDSIQIVFDLETTSPLKTLESNIIDFTTTLFDGRKMLNVNIPVSQVRLYNEEYSITRATGFNVNIPFHDQFYFCRAYMSDDDENWEEIVTTHSSQVYDPNVPTLVLAVGEGFLNASIPEIYLTKNRFKSSIRIEVYTTKGMVSEDLSVLGPDAYSATWNNFNGRYSEFVAPVNTLSTILIFSDSVLEGGTNEISFDELREKVIYNKFGKDVPMLFIELEKQLSDLGYRLTRLRDHILGRMYLASRFLEPATNSIFSGISAMTAYFQVDPSLNDNPSWMSDNGNRITLHPELLYKRVGFGTTIVPDATRSVIVGLDSDGITDELNENNYFYSPFFTIIDGDSVATNIRSYYLDSPSVKARSFVDNNSNLGYIVNTKSTLVTRVSNGFQIEIIAEIPEGLTGLNLQVILNSRDTGERWLCEAISSEVIGTEAKFVFSIETSFDIDSDNRIELTNLSELASGPNNIFMAIDAPIDIIYSVDSTVVTSTTFDNKFVRDIFTEPQSGVTYEAGILSFGELLEHYYSEVKANLKPEVFDTYSADVPLLHTKDVYESDANGPIYTPDGNGGITMNKLHAIGDPVLDEFDQPIMKYRAGDIRLDNDGNPVVLNPRSVVHEVKIPVLDARYIFANTSDIKDYVVEIPKVISKYLKEDIAPVSDTLLERTELPFAPASTNSNAEVRMSNGATTYMDTALSFTIQFTMTQRGYREDDIRNETRTSALKAIASELTKREISMSSILSAVKQAVSDEVIGIDISNILPEGGYAKLINDYDAFSLKSRLTILSNGSLDITDDVVVDYAVTA